MTHVQENSAAIDGKDRSDCPGTTGGCADTAGSGGALGVGGAVSTAGGYHSSQWSQSERHTLTEPRRRQQRDE